jgi:adenylate kinase family enzyme
MLRVSVVGSSGSGKTTFAAALARRLGVPHIELDSIFHQPGWTELPLEQFLERVGASTSSDGWVIDGNYPAVLQSIVWPRADTIVWLDLPRSLVITRIVPRTLTRVIFRRRLWNENRERWENLFSRDPERSIIAWSWAKHAEYRARYEGAMQDPRWEHARFVRLTTPRAIRDFLFDVA